MQIDEIRYNGHRIEVHTDTGWHPISTSGYETMPQLRQLNEPISDNEILCALTSSAILKPFLKEALKELLVEEGYIIGRMPDEPDKLPFKDDSPWP